MDKINTLFTETIENGSLIKIVFSGLRKKTIPYHRVTVRPVLIQAEVFYQVEFQYSNKVTHENLNEEQLLPFCNHLIAGEFKQINLFCTDGDYQILAAKPDKPRILKKPPSKELSSLEHNKKKQYILPDHTPCDFLIRLGVMDQSGNVIQKHYAKFRQINRFLEIVSDALDSLPKQQKPLRIIDFGCGKAYLTFALYHYLKKQLGRNVEIIGLDLKKDVIDFCSRIAQDLNYEGLQFQLGDIADYTDEEKADMVVTLHACDTATDYALIKAVGWDASVILSVPCCQHELFDQMSSELHAPMMKHGILKERFCAILTDGLRSLKLEQRGYQVTLIEFTSLEHTSKNIMIRAIKTGKPKPEAEEEYLRLKEYWSVNPTIDQL
ncbi:SAM-dependent methyltransferase [Anoxybacterium hadale]|uniref:SAM-dependent methyltransferase n=1 Tax=Anoxybacterium hadale TaxID=3408580 RepID=A0ACD1A770_9FIRM|nr:SAM-dependent methyltransferase [Clostridiales bacterium]